MTKRKNVPESRTSSINIESIKTLTPISTSKFKNKFVNYIIFKRSDFCILVLADLSFRYFPGAVCHKMVIQTYRKCV